MKTELEQLREDLEQIREVLYHLGTLEHGYEPFRRMVEAIQSKRAYVEEWHRRAAGFAIPERYA